MKNFMQINIQKSKNQSIFFLNDKEATIEEILTFIEEKSIKIIHIVTVEEGRPLVDCYVVYRNKTHFTHRLHRIAKAQV